MDKIKIEICVGTSCHLMGSNLILDFLENLPESIKTRLDISYISCLDKCSKGPLVRVGDLEIENTTPEELNRELEKQLL